MSKKPPRKLPGTPYFDTAWSPRALTKGRKPPRYVPRVQRTSEWSPDRDDDHPFLSLDACSRSEVVPAYPKTFRGTKEPHPWVVEADGTAKSPWGTEYPVRMLPPAVRELAERCSRGGPWKTVKTDAEALLEQLNANEYETCSTRMEALTRYHQMSGALRAATGLALPRPWGAETDLVGRCVRNRVERPTTSSSRRESLLELDGAAQDRRAEAVERAQRGIKQLDDDIFEQGGRMGSKIPGRSYCVNLVTSVLDAADADGALQAEMVGPNEPPNFAAAGRNAPRTLSWCLRPSPSQKVDSIAVEQFKQLDLDTPSPAVIRERLIAHREQYGNDDDIPPAPAPSRGSSPSSANFDPAADLARRRARAQANRDAGRPAYGSDEGLRTDAGAEFRRREEQGGGEDDSLGRARRRKPKAKAKPRRKGR